MASGLLMLLDDIATILDDVSVMTKVAAKKTAGILGDDLALNAEQVTGIQASRELPVVWAVAKGSLVNKVILVPSALLLSSLAPWLIDPLMIAGGTFLCFEGCEKLAHKFLHPKAEQEQQKQHEANVADPKIDLVAAEKLKVKGAIRTDFILSAEIIVITLGTVATAAFLTQVGVLVAIALLMTVGVYGLVAGIVKLDDIGLHLMKASADTTEVQPSGLRFRTGRMIVSGTPYLMKFLSIAGTAAMFLVGGGILAHGIPPVHHLIETMQHNLQQIAGVGGVLSAIAAMASQALLGIIIGSCVVAAVGFIKRFRKSAPQTT
jgi:predicted DNA repair protein MutK